MIDYIQGKLVSKNPTRVVVDHSGLGLSLQVSLATSEALGQPGDDVKVFTHLHHREDAMVLFGFATAEERRFFELLISVSGVGPKLALGILSGLSPQALCDAVLRQDLARLSKAPGVGKKTAERLVLELKDKVKDLAWEQPSASAPMALGSAADEAVLALVSLGYKPAQAEERVRKALGRSPDAAIETLIREALSQG